MKTTTFQSNRISITRHEFHELSGIAKSTLRKMKSQRRGPVATRPIGYSCDVYRLEDVQRWLQGETIPPWPDVSRPVISKRGKHLKTKAKPGRPPKKPKSTSLERGK